MKAVILYDDRESGCRAKRLFDRLTQSFAGHLEFALDLCRFDVLEVSLAAGSIWAQALEADLLVLAFHQGDLPPGVTAWLEEWAGCRTGQDQALVLLPDEPPGRLQLSSAALQALRVWASARGLNCLESWNLQTGLACRSFTAGLFHREQAITPTLQGIMARAEHPCYSRWGTTA